MLVRAAVHRLTHTMAAVRAFATATTLPDYDSFLTARSKARKPSPIRALQPLLAIPGMINFGSGMPNASLFPFKRYVIPYSPKFRYDRIRSMTLELLKIRVALKVFFVSVFDFL